MPDAENPVPTDTGMVYHPTREDLDAEIARRKMNTEEKRSEERG